MTEVIVRPMEPEDIDGILENDRKISGMDRAITYQGLVQKGLGGEVDMSFVAEVKDQVVGFLLAHLSYVREELSEACVIRIFGVDPAFQRKGIASKLIQTLIERCRAKKIGLIRVMVAERDGDLQGFFRRLGFERGRYVEYSRSL